jgi:hypothetical protein
MSTILKALKKLEQDKAASPPGGPLPIHASSGETNQSNQKERFAKVLLGILTASLILAFSVYSYLLTRDRDTRASSRATGGPAMTSPQDKQPGPRLEEQKQLASSGRTTPGPDSRAGAASVSPTENRLPSSPATSRPALANVSRPAPGPATSAPAQPARQATPAQQTARQPTARAPLGASQRVAAAPDKQVKAKPATPSSPVVSPQPAATPAKAQPEIARLTDGRLKAHAIAWSTDPEKCSAVINASIVHVGDSVDGFVVVTIEQESIILRETGGAMWRLVIGHP